MAFSTYHGDFVGGDDKQSSSLGSAKSSNQETWSFMNTSTLIVELYLQTSRTYSALGLKEDGTYMDPATSYDYSTYPWTTYNDTKYCTNKSYDFKTESSGNKIYVDSNSKQSPRKVFALHSKEESISTYPAHLAFGAKESTSVITSAYMGCDFGGLNTWVTHTDGDGNIYKSITVNSDGQFVPTTLSVKKGKKYTFNMHTVSEAGCDGIIISTSSLNSSVSVSTAGIARCHGVDAKSTYTYTPTSDGRIYIYFKTNSANLGESHESYDSRLGFITTYDGFTTGDVEIIVSVIDSVVLFASNGGTGGDTETVITYGTDMSTISVVPPTGKPYCKFAGYYTGSTRDEPGTMYIDSSGRGVSGKTWDIPYFRCTLYALYNYEPEILTWTYPLHCVYCTSSPASASTLQTDTAIELGVLGSSIDGNFSYVVAPGANRLPSSEMQDDTTLIIPAGTASGDYIFSIRYEFTPTDTSVFVKFKRAKYDIWVISTYLVNEVMDLESLTYLEQKKDIPAGSFTLNSNNVSEYFQYPIAIPSTTQIVYIMVRLKHQHHK